MYANGIELPYVYSLGQHPSRHPVSQPQPSVFRFSRARCVSIGARPLVEIVNIDANQGNVGSGVLPEVAPPRTLASMGAS